jgi:Ribbon-helix-helix protein, copG family
MVTHALTRPLQRGPAMSNTMTEDQPEWNRFVGPVAVSLPTADALGEIARMEGQTVSWVVRRALEGYTSGYLRSLVTDGPVGEQERP